MPDGELMKGEKHSVNEVAPPGFGHTKGDKKKGVEKGGTAAAFDKARKEGRFKGSKSDMFAIMWSQKKKGDKPHYKPGTNKKFKKYQEEVVDEALVSRRKKDWPKGSIDPDDNKMKLAKDLIDLEKQGAPRWTVSQLRAKKMKNEEASMPNVDSKDRKVIKDRAKNLFKKDLKGEHQGVNEAVKGQDTDSRKEGAKERATEKRAHASWKPGTKKRPLYSTTRHTKGDAESYATQQKQSIDWHDKRTKGKHITGTTTEAVKDPTKKKPKAPQFNAAKELVADAPYMKPALQQKEEVSSYKDYIAQAQAAKDRLKKKIEDRKKKDAQYSDYKAKGVRFYDKKGKGRIVKGRKVYD